MVGWAGGTGWRGARGGADRCTDSSGRSAGQPARGGCSDSSDRAAHQPARAGWASRRMRRQQARVQPESKNIRAEPGIRFIPAQADAQTARGLKAAPRPHAQNRRRMGAKWAQTGAWERPRRQNVRCAPPDAKSAGQQRPTLFVCDIFLCGALPCRRGAAVPLFCAAQRMQPGTAAAIAAPQTRHPAPGGPERPPILPRRRPAPCGAPAPAPAAPRRTRARSPKARARSGSAPAAASPPAR